MCAPNRTISREKVRVFFIIVRSARNDEGYHTSTSKKDNCENAANCFSAGLGVISNPLGALIGGTLAELFGRRMTLLIAAFPYVVGWLLISVSTDLYWLGAGRFVTGFAVGKANQKFLSH